MREVSILVRCDRCRQEATTKTLPSVTFEGFAVNLARLRFDNGQPETETEPTRGRPADKADLCPECLTALLTKGELVY